MDLLVVQGTLESLLQHHSSKASILWCSAFFVVQDFPGGSDGKESIYNVGDPGSSPGLGRSPGEGCFHFFRAWRLFSLVLLSSGSIFPIDAEVHFHSQTRSQQENRNTYSQDMSSAELFPFVSEALAFLILSSMCGQDTVLSYFPMQFYLPASGAPHITPGKPSSLAI